MCPVVYGVAIAAQRFIVGGNGFLTSDSTMIRARPTAATGCMHTGGPCPCFARPSRCST